MKVGVTAALWLCFVLSPASAEPTELRVGGTGAATELLRQLAAEFGKETGYRTQVVASLGTTGGLRALADDHLDVAVAGRALKPEEEAKGLKVAMVMRTPFVLVTSHRAPSGLASADVVRAFADPDQSWADGTPIRVILRPRSESDVMLMTSLFPGLAEAMEKARQRPDVPVAATDQDNADLAERTPGSLIGMCADTVAAREARPADSRHRRRRCNQAELRQWDLPLHEAALLRDARAARGGRDYVPSLPGLGESP